jgi:hypothetical protein
MRKLVSDRCFARNAALWLAASIRGRMIFHWIELGLSVHVHVIIAHSANAATLPRS